MTSKITVTFSQEVLDQFEDDQEGLENLAEQITKLLEISKIPNDLEGYDHLFETNLTTVTLQ